MTYEHRLCEQLKTCLKIYRLETARRQPESARDALARAEGFRLSLQILSEYQKLEESSNSLINETLLVEVA